MTIEHTKSARWKKGSVRPARKNSSPIVLNDETIFEEGQQVHPGHRMTEAEFVAWVHEKTRAEWVDGEVIIMSPVSDRHADIHSWLNSILRLWVEKYDLGCIRGDLMVRLAKPKSRRVPDLYFFSKVRASLQHQNYFEGPPDAVFEIVSPDSTARDYRDKLKSYEASGVKEYWIIDPLSNSVEVNELVRARYRTIEPRDGIIHSKAIKGFWLRIDWFTQRPLPMALDVLKELGVT